MMAPRVSPLPSSPLGQSVSLQDMLFARLILTHGKCIPHPATFGEPSSRYTCIGAKQGYDSGSRGMSRHRVFLHTLQALYLQGLACLWHGQ